MDRMKLGAAVLAAGVVLSGCSHSAAGHPVAEPAASSTPGPPDVDVQALWAQTARECPVASSQPTDPPPDPDAVGGSAWPTNAEIAQVLDGMRPAGSRDFTYGRLMLFRAEVVSARGGMLPMIEPPDYMHMSADMRRGVAQTARKIFDAVRDVVTAQVNSGRLDAAPVGPDADFATRLTRSLESEDGGKWALHECTIEHFPHG